MNFISVLGLALAMMFAPFLGTSAQAAAPGFHAAYFSESAFLTLAPGETGQFSVGFSNTGDQSWVKGVTGKQASLHTAAPLDNPLDSTLGWGPTWAAPNIYAIQANDLVVPGQIGFFVYNVKVPTTQPLGSKTFYGRPVIDGVGPMEDYGYFHVVTVAGGVRVSTITPASPSTNDQPTLSGTDAVVNEPITITDGASGPVVGTAFAGSTGSWSIPLTSRLRNGAHTLFANSVGKGQSAGVPYTVTGAVGPVVLSAYATGISTVQVQFSTAMKCTASTDRTDMLSATSYFLNEEPSGVTGPTVSSVTASSDCTGATLNTGALTTGRNYSVTVHFLKDAGNTTIDSTRNKGTFSISAPSIRTVEAKQDGSAIVVFSRSMDITNANTGSQSVLNPNNFTVDSVTSPTDTTISCLLTGLNGCITIKILFPGGASSVLGASGAVRNIGVSNVIDALTGGQLQSPNPSTRQVAIGQ